MRVREVFIVGVLSLSLTGCSSSQDRPETEGVNTNSKNDSNKPQAPNNIGPDSESNGGRNLGGGGSSKSFDDLVSLFWRANMADSKIRQTWFTRMVSMYDRSGKQGEYFDSSNFPGMYGFLESTYSSEDGYGRISRESRLIHSKGHKLDDVIHSLIWRVPGYAGGLAKGWFNEDTFSYVYGNRGSEPDLFGRAKSMKPPSGIDPNPLLSYPLMDGIDRAYAYAILSPAKVYRTNQLDSHWVHVLHTWGVNFESGSTQDWKKLVETSINSDGTLNEGALLSKYQARMDELLQIIQQGIVETAKILTAEYPSISELNVRIPGIGLNNFLKGLESKFGSAISAKCKLQFYNGLSGLYKLSDSNLGSSPLRVNLSFIAFGTLPANIAALLVRPSTQTEPLVTPQGQTIFDYNESKPGAYYLLINPWDPLSFIGNGGSRDHSMDGWFGGGYASSGSSKPFACTCWLSNLFMNPALIEHVVVTST